MDSKLASLWAKEAAQQIETLRNLRDLSNAPEDVLNRFFTGEFMEFVSPLQSQLSQAQLDYLITSSLEALPRKQVTIEAKGLILEIIRNLSRSVDIRSKLYKDPRMVSTLLQFAEQGPSLEAKSFAIGTLNNLAIEDEISKGLLQNYPQICPILLNCCREPHNDELVHKKALKTLMNLTASRENAPVLVAHPGLLELLMEEAESGMSICSKERAMKAINNLSYEPLVRMTIFERPGLADVVMKCAEHGESLSLKQTSLQVMFLLADSPGNKVRMFQKPDLVETLLRCIRNDDMTNVGVKEWAIVSLIVLSGTESHKVALFQKPLMVDTMLQVINTASPNHDFNKIKEWALGAMMVLASAEANKLPLFSHEHVVDTVVNAIILGDTDYIRENAIGTMYNLASNAMIARSLYSSKKLLYYLVDLVTDDTVVETSKVKGRGTDLLNKLGCSKPRAHYFLTMTTLCLVFDIPRLGRNSHLQMLNKDIIRAIGSVLLPH